MNKERILALADLIEVQPHVKIDAHDDPASGFNMNSTMHSCGTPACIAGWAAWEAKGRPENLLAWDHTTDMWWLEKAAADYIEIPCGRADDTHHFPLFYPPGYSYGHITPAQAATVLRHLAETGEIDWSIVGIKDEEENEDE